MNIPDEPGAHSWIDALEQAGVRADAPEDEHDTVISGEAMTLAEARRLRRVRGSRLVLMMGEQGTGKTALLASLWQRMQATDGLAEHRLAGSRTALGFERRAHGGRIASGHLHARFLPTDDDDAFLLHMRVRPPSGDSVDLVFADLGGSVFERVREGRPLLQELPLAAHSDRFVVVVDGEALSTPGESEIAATRAMRQILALRSSGAVRASARVAVALTKADVLTPAGERAFRRHVPHLLFSARGIDAETTSVRTGLPDLVTEPGGLGELVRWLCAGERHEQLVATAAEIEADRANTGLER
ncbi:MAG TPA: hypothetical protein VHX66_03460 [Solirubrobacteraceae bacterium]|jgi:hypothetical protein|nr:hypothetical protein [Solirubrobacteraceae bacterium]